MNDAREEGGGGAQGDQAVSEYERKYGGFGYT
jgi:hypothetical protein